jgi:hypothetical protein
MSVKWCKMFDEALRVLLAVWMVRKARSVNRFTSLSLVCEKCTIQTRPVCSPDNVCFFAFISGTGFGTDCMVNIRQSGLTPEQINN